MKVKNLYRDITKRRYFKAFALSGRADKSGSVDFATPALLALRCHSRRSIMAIFTDELSRLGEGIIIVLHDEATLLPVA